MSFHIFVELVGEEIQDRYSLEKYYGICLAKEKSGMRKI